MGLQLTNCLFFYQISVPSNLLNELNHSLPDDLLFDDPSSTSTGAGPSGAGPGGPGGPGQVGPGQQPNSSMAGPVSISSSMAQSVAVSSQGGQGGNVVTMATGGQQIRPAMGGPGQGTPTSAVVANGVAVGGIVTSSSQQGQGGPIMVQGGMRPNGPQPGGPIVSNPNMTLVNTFGNNGPQVKMTPGGTVVSNGPVMTLPGPDGTMGNGMVRPGGPGPGQGPNSIIAQRVMVGPGNQQPGLIRGMVRGPMMQGPGGQFRPGGMPGQMVQHGPTIVGMPNQRQPIMRMQVQPGQLVTNHQPFNPVNTTNVNTMQMTPNGPPMRPQIPGGPNGPQVNMPPQYPNTIESSGKIDTNALKQTLLRGEYSETELFFDTFCQDQETLP